MTDNECRCTRPLNGDAYLCQTCAREATADLTTVARLLALADEKRAMRGTAWRYGIVGRSADKALPYDPRVTNTIAPVARQLTAVARLHDSSAPTDPIRLALWLSQRTGYAATKAWANEAFTAYHDARETLTRLFDIAPDREAIGQCGAETDNGTCTEILSAEKGATVHRCPRCSTAHQVADRRDELMGQAEDFTVTVAEAVTLMRTTRRTHVDARFVRAVIRHVPIRSAGQRAEVDIKGRWRKVDVYRLGAIRDAAEEYENDPETKKAIRRTMRGGKNTA